MAAQRVGIATSTAFDAFRRSYTDPGLAVPAGLQSPQRGSYTARTQHYAMLWAWYENRAFEDQVMWRRYLQEYRMYRATRSIYNPVRRLVDFYAAQVYPGILAIDANKLPDGIPLAIPIADDAPQELKTAIGQWWQWTNWQAGKAVIVRYAACTGDVLIELVDDVEKGKVVANIVWPAYVSDLELDSMGNIKSYALEYLASDDLGQPYIYRKEVDGERFRTLKDNEPHAYDDAGAEIENPYGFVPAVWIKHTDLGSDHGAGAIRGLAKLDELNSLVSHVHDQMHKAIAAPQIFWADGSVVNLQKAAISATRGRLNQGDEQSPIDLPDADREQVLLLKGPQGGSVSSLLGNLRLNEALPYIQQLLIEIEQDHPELAMYNALRQMRVITGPAAQRLMGDVAGLVYEVQAQYDLQSIKLMQMACAIAGWRVNSGDWGRPNQLTPQQQKFRPFDLDSYAAGELDFEIGPRPLVPPTAIEVLELERARLQLEADRQGLQLALAQARAEGIPIPAPAGDNLESALANPTGQPPGTGRPALGEPAAAGVGNPGGGVQAEEITV